MEQSFIGAEGYKLLFTWVNFLIIYFILKKFLFQPVRDIIKKRQNEIAKSYQDADEAMAKAKQMQAEYNDKMRSAKDDIAMMIQEANKRAENNASAIIEDAKKEANALKKKAQVDIEREKEKAAVQIKSDLGNMSTSIAETLLKREITEQDQSKLVEEFLNQVAVGDHQ